MDTHHDEIGDVSVAGARITARPFDPDSVLDGELVRLRPVRTDDVVRLHRLAMSLPASARWRFHGMLASAEQFAQEALSVASLNTVIEARADAAIVGFAQCVGTDLRHGHSSLWVMTDPRRAGSVEVREALALVCPFAFSVLPVHRLTISVADVEATQPDVEVLLAGFTHEGTLRRHVLVDGERRDLLIYGITRDEAEAVTR